MAIVHYEDYKIFKYTLDKKMAETANNFVSIGYLLKEARDTNILAESGYSSMGEFARNEYGLDESKTSRFIAICERYGNGEDRLLPQYEQFGYAKLSEMLTLPESVTEVITPEMTKEEIREIKAEVREEETISDLEVRLEEQPETDDILREAIKAYLHEFPEEFRRIFTAKGDWKELMEAAAPSGSATWLMRVSGVGRMMIRINDYESPVKLVSVRENSITEYSIAVFTAAIDAAIDSAESLPKDAWREIYGEEMPAKVEEKKKEKPKKENLKIAPAQKKKTWPIKPPKEEKEKKEAAESIQPEESFAENAINPPAEEIAEASADMAAYQDVVPKGETENNNVLSVPEADDEENSEGSFKERIEEIIKEMCEHYCKYPNMYDEEKEGVPLFETDICKNCPLERIMEIKA